MKRHEEEKATQGPLENKKHRFKIEKLEERIAPRCVKIRGYKVCYGHYNPHGKYVGAGKQ